MQIDSDILWINGSSFQTKMSFNLHRKSLDLNSFKHFESLNHFLLISLIKRNLKTILKYFTTHEHVWTRPNTFDDVLTTSFYVDTSFKETQQQQHERKKRFSSSLRLHFLYLSLIFIEFQIFLSWYQFTHFGHSEQSCRTLAYQEARLRIGPLAKLIVTM